MLERVLATDCVVKLYTNNLNPEDGTHGTSGEDVPDAGDVGGPVECTVSGYAPITIAGGSWTVATTSGETLATCPMITFTFASAVNIYGVFFTEPTGGTLWLQRLDGAPIGVAAGGELEMLPEIGCD